MLLTYPFTLKSFRHEVDFHEIIELGFAQFNTMQFYGRLRVQRLLKCMAPLPANIIFYPFNKEAFSPTVNRTNYDTSFQLTSRDKDL